MTHLNFAESQCFHECLPNFCNRHIAYTMIKNFWYPSIQEIVLSENLGFQLAKTEISFKSKFLSNSYKTEVQVVLLDPHTSVYSYTPVKEENAYPWKKGSKS